MTTPFQDFRKLMAERTLLSTDFHAERFNVWAGGSQSRVSATRRHTQPMIADGNDEAYLTESIALTVGRDPTDASGGIDTDGYNIPGGIATPAIGLSIQSVADDDGRKFAFTGEIIAATPHTWTLGFARRVPQTTGTAGIRR